MVTLYCSYLKIWASQFNSLVKWRNYCLNDKMEHSDLGLHCLLWHVSTYSWLLLSQLCSSRITTYLTVKIWSLFKHENLTMGDKILWKRGEIASKEQFLLLSTIFLIYFCSEVRLHIHLWNVVGLFILSSVLQLLYAKIQYLKVLYMFFFPSVKKHMERDWRKRI